MADPVIVVLPPDRPTIALEVHSKVSVEQFVVFLCDEMKAKRTMFPKTVLYVRTLADCSNVYYLLLKQVLGKYFTDPAGYPSHPDYHLIDMFTVVQATEKKKEMLCIFLNLVANCA